MTKTQKYMGEKEESVRRGCLRILVSSPILVGGESDGEVTGVRKVRKCVRAEVPIRFERVMMKDGAYAASTGRRERPRFWEKMRENVMKER